MKRVVVAGVDGSPRSRVAADWAALEALRRGLPLLVAHVSPFAAGRSATTGRGSATSVPDEVAAQLTERHPGLEAKGAALAGEPLPLLLALGAWADLMVLGLRGAGGHAGLSLGSVAGGVAAEAPSPVVLVPAGPTCTGTGEHLEKVVLGVDARDPVEAAIDFALDTAKRRGARLRVLYACSSAPPVVGQPPPPGFGSDLEPWEEKVRRLSELLRPWRDKYPGVRVVGDVVVPGPSHPLIRVSYSAELAVVGRHGRTLGPAMLGLLRDTGCPVAVVPPA
ncbi:universal stress protein [Streptomyces sp. NPDC057877]|uniref:universal stress protein n=1 Tax=Streptomyces sp. NPDC057877 TaxID=3346269 RepID=UPI00367E8E77